MSNCNITTPISETLCISDSLSILNGNFNNLDTTLCSLCSVSNNLIANLNNFSSIYNSNIFNVLNIINTPQILGIVAITPYSYTVFVQQVYRWSGVVTYYGSFLTPMPPIIPVNANFILIRADLSFGFSGTITVNGINIPYYTSQISGISTYPYASIPISNIYNIEISQTMSGMTSSGGAGRLIPYQYPLSIRIIGYC